MYFCFPDLVGKRPRTVLGSIGHWTMLPSVTHVAPCVIIIGYQFATHSLKDEAAIKMCSITIVYGVLAFMFCKIILAKSAPYFA